MKAFPIANSRFEIGRFWIEKLGFGVPGKSEDQRPKSRKQIGNRQSAMVLILHPFSSSSLILTLN
jgi:hypothetical protein